MLKARQSIPHGQTVMDVDLSRLVAWRDKHKDAFQEREGPNLTFTVLFVHALARQLGETLCTTISRLRLPNSESIAANHVTASVAAVTGQVKRGIDRIYLLTQAISKVKEAIAAGGNRVLALSV